MRVGMWPLMLLSVMSAPVFGAVYTASATVSVVRSHDSSLASPDWFSLSNVTSLGTCGVYNGAVIFRISEDERSWRQFAMVLSAKAKGLSVNVQVDDTVKDQHGFCIVSFIEY